MVERTLILVKPDGVRRGLIGDVLSRIEAKGLQIVAKDLRNVDRNTAEAHYAEHAVRPFFGQLVDFTVSGPLVALVAEGPRAIEAFRVLAGSTDPIRASMGTIREIMHWRYSRTLCTDLTQASPQSGKSRSSFPTSSRQLLSLAAGTDDSRPGGSSGDSRILVRTGTGTRGGHTAGRIWPG